MVKKMFNLLLSGFLLLGATQLAAQSEFDEYHTNKQVQLFLKKLEGKNTRLHTIAESPGGEPVTVLEIGTDLEDVPAIFVGANFEGDLPLATEGALYLAKMIQDSIAYTKNVRWYIMPQPNPDAAKGYFAEIKSGLKVNEFPINDDGDEALNEDGFDDLNGDGFITMMRVKSPEGAYVISKNNPFIMDKANTSKGERGVYEMYSEGLDNDGDGLYNEDATGGINIGLSFPHLFPREKSEAGLYSGQTPEVYGIMRFIFDHPDIAMVYTLGSSNFCLVPPRGGRKGEANLEKIKIPSRYGKMFGIDVSETYTMNEVVEMFKELVPADMEVTPALVAGFLGLGAAVNPQEDDLVFYKEFAEDYKKYLDKKAFDTELLPPTPAQNGSFELWAYYHLGVPSFSMNLFSVPEVKEEKQANDKNLSLEEVENMSAEDFVALGEEKINSFLRANNAPDRFKAEGVIKMMQDGQITPEKMVGMLKQAPKTEKEGELSKKDKALLAYSENEWNGKGFVQWEKVSHPTFGQVEVGGFIPYLESTPKPEKIAPLLSVQLPWLLQLSTKLPELKLEDKKVTNLGAGIYKLEIFVANNGELAYPISIGERNKQPAPVILTIDGDIEILEGKLRTPVGAVGANQVKKFSWLIKTVGKNPTITATVESAVLKDDVEQINIGG